MQVFKAQEGLEKAVATEEHNIKNKKVAVKKAQAKQGKVYVGKLPKDDKLSDDAIKEFFAGYGAIAAVEQPFDKVLLSLFRKNQRYKEIYQQLVSLLSLEGSTQLTLRKD